MVSKKVVSNELAFSISSEVASAAAAAHSSHSPQTEKDYQIRKMCVRAHFQYNIKLNCMVVYIRYSMESVLIIVE